MSATSRNEVASVKALTINSPKLAVKSRSSNHGFRFFDQPGSSNGMLQLCADYRMTAVRFKQELRRFTKKRLLSRIAV